MNTLWLRIVDANFRPITDARVRPVTAEKERHGILPTVPLNFLSLCCTGKRMKIPAVVLAFLLGLPVLGTCQSTALSAEVAAPATPAAVKGILAARRFT